MSHIRTARDAEINAAKHMQEMGFSDTQVTVGGPDSGIDVVSTKAIAQVKFWNRPVGRPALQCLYGARVNSVHRNLLFYSSAGYSKTAHDYADRHGIALFTFDVFGAVRAENEAARTVRHRSSSAGTAPALRDPAVDRWIAIREKNAAAWAREYQSYRTRWEPYRCG